MYRVSHDVDLVEDDGLGELSETVELVQFDADHAILVRLERALSRQPSTINHQSSTGRDSPPHWVLVLVSNWSRLKALVRGSLE